MVINTQSTSDLEGRRRPNTSILHRRCFNRMLGTKFVFFLGSFLDMYDSELVTLSCNSETWRKHSFSVCTTLSRLYRERKIPEAGCSELVGTILINGPLLILLLYGLEAKTTRLKSKRESRIEKRENGSRTALTLH